jgi:hypothetical protein
MKPKTTDCQRCHPILFSSAMVRAILEGRKTQTRRVMKPQPQGYIAGNEECWEWRGYTWNQRIHAPADRIDYRGGKPLPYGQPGDRIWVRETFWASRITLEITEVRVERLQEISESDAEAEGVTSHGGLSAVFMYAELWDSLNEKRGHGWDLNPWVWVIEFQPLPSPRMCAIPGNPNAGSSIPADV